VHLDDGDDDFTDGDNDRLEDDATSEEYGDVVVKAFATSLP